MWIRALVTAVLFAASGSVCLAETYGEKIKSVDPEKKTITFPVDGKDRTFKVDDKVDVQAQMRAGKRLRITPVKEGLKGVKAGSEATVTTEKKDGEEVVTKIVLLAGEQKK
jgi:hypothetical protein